MKIVLDENLPVKLRAMLGIDHQVFSVRQLGWDGKKNGELLELLIINQFDLLITLDKNLTRQNKIISRPIAVLVLSARNSKLETLIPFEPKIQQLINLGITKGQVSVIELP